jgi:hypothetical protein
LEHCAWFTQGVARGLALPWAVIFRAFSPSFSGAKHTKAKRHAALFSPWWNAMLFGHLGDCIMNRQQPTSEGSRFTIAG